MTVSDPIRIAQLSDTHFLEAGAEPEGGHGYNIAEAFDAVHAHVESGATPDLITVTGDVADHGRSAQYRMAAEAFSRFTAPVNVCPGNHDQDKRFAAGMGRPRVGVSRVIEAGPWCFLFADSNAGIMVTDESGRLVDPEDYNDRLHRNGSLGAREASWIRETATTTEADHVFIWIHHPPAPVGGLPDEAHYAREWSALLSDLPKLRGVGAGHTHVPDQYEFEKLPVFVAPSLKNNFDVKAKTWLPPGYRTFEFAADGTINSDVQLIDDGRWPRNPVGRAVISYLTGQLSSAEFQAIVARKQAERSAGT